MYRLTLFLSLPIIGIASPNLWAQTYLMKLPKDGSWANYEFEAVGLDEDENEWPAKGMLTFRCINTVYENMEAFRWIEFDTNYEYQGNRHRHVVKALIPEERLANGKNPIGHVKKLWESRSIGSQEPTAQLIESDDQIAEKLHGYLAVYDRDQVDLEMKTVNSGLGKLACVGYGGQANFENKMTTTQRSIEVFTHSKAKFGSILINYKKSLSRDGVVYYRSSGTYRLKDQGTDAKSALPKYN